MNKWTGVGRVTKDIELKKTPNGKSYTQFFVAIRRDEKTTDFIQCVAWEKRAELMAKYVHKGNRIAVSGRVQTRSYEANGAKHYVTEIVADEVEFLENKTPQEPQKPQYQSGQGYADETGGFSIDASDLPF